MADNKSRVKFMYSNDHLIGDFGRSTGTTHEISMVFELDGLNLFGTPDPAASIGRSRRSHRSLECPC